MDYKKRAISDSEKRQRFQHIIETAEKLFLEADFHEITMAKIASEAGLAKGTLFIYFQTKEDVFLSLMEQKITHWSSKLANQMETIDKEKRSIQVEEFIDVLICSVDDKILSKLFAILDDTLEKNVDFKREVEFKTFLKHKMIQLGQLVEAILPILQVGDGVKILNQLFICLIGAYKVSNPSPIIMQVLQQPGLEMFKRDFIETLREMATYHVFGYLLYNKRV